MNTIKYIFFTTTLIVVYNASGMFGLGQQLLQKPSHTQHQRVEYDSLGLLYLNDNEQIEFFKYNNRQDYSNQRFQELVRIAKKNRFNETAKKDPQIRQITKPADNTKAQRLTRITSKKNKFNITITSSK